MSLDEKTRKYVRNGAIGLGGGLAAGDTIENAWRNDKKKFLYIGIGAVAALFVENLASKGVFKKATDYVAEKANALRNRGKEQEYQTEQGDG